MRIRLLLAVLAAVLMIFGGLPAGYAGPHIVVDAGTGKVLSQEEPFRRWFPASLTKLMTTYVTFRAIKAGEITLKSPVVFSSNATKEPPSKMGFKRGTVLTVDNAIKILMVKSANDVATAVAESVGGSVPAFAARMNAEAQRLGMVGSHWVNAHGLHSDNQYTTAHDLALLAIAIRREFPYYDSYFAIEAIRSGKSLINNHNSMIMHFKGADGMKTGYTCPSGFNLVASAKRGGRRIIAVVIGEESVDQRAEKAADLMTRAFNSSGFGAQRLESMRPSGAMQNTATNMRPVICNKDARKERFANRDKNGKTIIESPYLTKPSRPRRVVQIDLGGTTGPMPAPQIANIPIPTPRPDYTPLTAEGG